MTAPVIIILTAQAEQTAAAIKEIWPEAQIYAREERAQGDYSFTNISKCLSDLFQQNRPIIGVMAAGALIRIIAPLLTSKHQDPPVIALTEDGASVVPLLGGHHGANRMAQDIADKLGGHAAITTASDARFGVALDDPPAGWTLTNPEHLKPVTAALLAGGKAQIKGSAPWLEQAGLPLGDDGEITLLVTEQATKGDENTLVYAPKTLALGVGCERDCEPDELIELVENTFTSHGLCSKSISCLCSLDLKADEAAVHQLAEHFGVPARFFTAAQLEAEAARLATPSDVVFAEVGCHGVSEGAALAMAGPDASLIVAKQKSSRATCAITRAPEIIDPQCRGRARGKLAIVGIGPGSEDWRTPEATRRIAGADIVVGYSLYLDLLGSSINGKIRHDYGLGEEEARVRHALELAGQGNSVALICSGDAGIYAMGALVFELLDKGGLPDSVIRAEILPMPGISALQAAAARAGAPLGHDFCAISLSDLLTPWEAIQKRLKAAAEGDFVIAFYNPVSKRRTSQLATARDILLAHRPADTPVILARNLGREGETISFRTLTTLDIDEVDMLTTVLIGSSTSTIVQAGGRQWMYTPRGYEKKFKQVTS